jgi:hypothetical protein
MLVIMMVLMANIALGQPTGAQITYNLSETKQPSPADWINTSGGTFTTMILYAETQNPRWKAYAGNVSGTLVLDDALGFTIYNWNLTYSTGKVFASRNDSVDFDNIQCAPQGTINAENTAMNHSQTAADSINATFPYKIHKEFYVGTTYIQNSTCRSTVTWVNDTKQQISEDALFQEILLTDLDSLVYTTLLLDSKQGFNFKRYDFQMIVAEKDLPGLQATPYYFYMELA